jgi:hypothetical protein
MDVNINQGISMKLKDYFTYSGQAIEENPMYLFDSEFGEKRPAMLDDYRYTTTPRHATPRVRSATTSPRWVSKTSNGWSECMSGWMVILTAFPSTSPRTTSRTWRTPSVPPSAGSLSAPPAPVCTAQHSTAQHSTAQHSTAQHSTAQQAEEHVVCVCVVSVS